MTSTQDDIFPKALIAVSYSDIFGKGDGDIAGILKELPMIVVLSYVLKSHLTIHFSMYARDPHNKILDELCQDLYKPERTNLYRFRKQHDNHVILYNTDSTLRMCFETLKFGYDLDHDDSQITPTREEAIEIAKAYALCNRDWIESQKIESDVPATMLMLDLPVSEFKFHKDVKAAMYKASQFFQFCKANQVYDNYLAAFLEDYGVNDWIEYIGRLFTLFHHSINKFAIQVNSKDVDTIKFFSNFTINRDRIRKIDNWNNPEALQYLRNHFLIPFTNGIYYVISPDLIVDKIYQGLKFMFFDSIHRHGILQQNGKPFDKLPQFTDKLGEDFSEIALAYPLFNKSLSGWVDRIITGATFNQNGLNDGEPDLYIRLGKSLMLIEIKDLLFKREIQSSSSPTEITNYINSRICKYPEKPHKGFGQIIDNIERLANGEFDKFDSDASQVNVIYPVIVTTDNAYSAFGVNAEIVKKASEIMNNIGNKFGRRFISIPIILDIDTLINLSYLLSTGELNLFQIFKDYILQCRGGLISFKAFAYERYLKNRVLTREESKFLFGTVFPEE